MTEAYRLYLTKFSDVDNMLKEHGYPAQIKLRELIDAVKAVVEEQVAARNSEK